MELASFLHENNPFSLSQRGVNPRNHPWLRHCECVSFSAGFKIKSVIVYSDIHCPSFYEIVFQPRLAPTCVCK